MAAPAWITRKVAGVPAWGWLAAAGLAIGVGLYLRRRAVATAGSGGGQSDIGQGLAGGTPEAAPSGLDPALAELLANATNAIGQIGQTVPGAIDGGPFGSFDPGTGFDQGAGLGAPAVTNVAASGAGTTFRDPSPFFQTGARGTFIPAIGQPLPRTPVYEQTHLSAPPIAERHLGAPPPIRFQPINWLTGGGGAAAASPFHTATLAPRATSPSSGKRVGSLAGGGRKIRVG